MEVLKCCLSQRQLIRPIIRPTDLARVWWLPAAMAWQHLTSLKMPSGIIERPQILAGRLSSLAQGGYSASFAAPIFDNVHLAAGWSQTPEPDQPLSLRSANSCSAQSAKSLFHFRAAPAKLTSL